MSHQDNVQKPYDDVAFVAKLMFARSLLFLNGMLTPAENVRLHKRISKYVKDNGLEYDKDESTFYTSIFKKKI